MKRKQSSKDRTTTVSIAAYDTAQPPTEASVCRKLRAEIERALPDATSKVWHGSPVWFVGEIPVVGHNAEIQVTSLRRWLKQAGTEIWDKSSIRTSRARAQNRG